MVVHGQQRVLREVAKKENFFSYRLGWRTNAAGVGQSFPAERLGMTLTSRLRTPPDRPSHHTRRGPLSFFFSPALQPQV